MMLILVYLMFLSVIAIRTKVNLKVYDSSGCLTSQNYYYCNYTDSCNYITEPCSFSQCTNLTKLFNDNL